MTISKSFKIMKHFIKHMRHHVPSPPSPIKCCRSLSSIPPGDAATAGQPSTSCTSELECVPACPHTSAALCVGLVFCRRGRDSWSKHKNMFVSLSCVERQTLFAQSKQHWYQHTGRRIKPLKRIEKTCVG